MPNLELVNIYNIKYNLIIIILAKANKLREERPRNMLIVWFVR